MKKMSRLIMERQRTWKGKLFYTKMHLQICCEVFKGRKVPLEISTVQFVFSHDVHNYNFTCYNFVAIQPFQASDKILSTLLDI